MRLVIAFVLMVAVTLIAASVLSGLTRTMPYEGEPQFTQNPPRPFLDEVRARRSPVAAPRFFL